MRAVQYSAHGAPDVLHVVDIEAPHPGPGEIVIQVSSAGVNQLDTKIRSGSMAAAPDLQSPQGTGFDAAGTVMEIGPGVDGIAPGDVVFGTGRNTLAERAVLTEWARLPVGIDPVAAGGWGVAVETSHRLLTELGVTQGVILLSGASGGVGSALIQLARARGLRVIGTASERNHAYLEQLGATPVTYGPGLVDRVRAIVPDGVDGALDLSGAGVIADLVTLSGDASKVISISDFTAPQHGARVSTGATRTTNPRDGFAEALAVPDFALHVEHRFTLAQAADAHRAAEGGHTVGKLLVLP
jgi:NADPH:quinone reductase-like Zn-dependent oxidoreductase